MSTAYNYSWLTFFLRDNAPKSNVGLNKLHGALLCLENFQVARDNELNPCTCT